jgi:tRNA(fMet)-specific endonuclease VapC
MIILDTDVLSLVQRDDSPPGLRVRAKIAQLPATELVVTTIVTYHEQTSGWLAYLAKARGIPQHIYAYSLLEKHLDDYRKTRVARYDRAAADVFDQIRSQHPRMGTMDLRIASIVLSLGALLVSRNINDFSKIAGIRVEDWTRP